MAYHKGFFFSLMEMRKSEKPNGTKEPVRTIIAGLGRTPVFPPQSSRLSEILIYETEKETRGSSMEAEPWSALLAQPASP